MEKIQADYSIIREDFSEYECENGQILRIKTTILSIKNIKDNPPRSEFDFHDNSLVLTPTPIDTSTLEYARNEDVTDKDVVKKLNFKILKDIINIYETKRSIIILCPEIESIFLTNKKDQDGNPILRYILKNSLNIINKEALKKVPNSSPNPN